MRHVELILKTPVHYAPWIGGSESLGNLILNTLHHLEPFNKNILKKKYIFEVTLIEPPVFMRRLVLQRRRKSYGYLYKKDVFNTRQTLLFLKKIY